MSITALPPSSVKNNFEQYTSYKKKTNPIFVFFPKFEKLVETRERTLPCKITWSSITLWFSAETWSTRPLFTLVVLYCVLVICLIAFGPPVKRSPSWDDGQKGPRFLPLISILFTSKAISPYRLLLHILSMMFLQINVCSCRYIFGLFFKSNSF